MSNSGKEEKRKKERRRDFNSAQTFPYAGVAEYLARQDRRRMPDRRLNNIHLEILPLQSADIG
jgi:hypothetical protein